MINFGNVQKYIYFPKAFERPGDPYVVHVLERWGNDWKGNRDLEELLGGRFSFYPLTRCQPYSDELWEKCRTWMERKRALVDDFEKMMKKGVKHELS